MSDIEYACDADDYVKNEWVLDCVSEWIETD